MARKQCRIWWPEQLLYREPDTDLLLFGWCMNSANSADFVVAHATSAAKISAAVGELELQDILHSINSKMPMPLQEASTFCMLGHCAMCCRNGDIEAVQNQQIDYALKGMQFHGLEENAGTGTIRCNDVNGDYKENIPVIASHVKNRGGWSCGCKIQNQYTEDFLSRHGNWIQLLSKSQGILYKGSKWIPEFHHMHQSGHILTNCDIHLVIYEPPTYGRRHVSVNSWGYCERIVTPFKKPNWFSELYKKPEKPNLEAVVWALNCASAAMISFNGFFSTIDPATNCSIIISRLLCMLWYVLAVFVASMSTVLYVFLQLFHIFVRLGSHSLCSVMLQKLFTQTWNNFNVRSRQFLYWPIFLVGTGFRGQPNLEYAHMTELRKHSIWSSIAIDVIMGIFFGMVTLANAGSVYNGTLFVARNINDNLLRSGCVWLMGVPAGFKLNTELAEVLGMVSLNAIQIFSTLWFFLGSLFGQLIKGLALSGIFFGLTIPAALCIDMLKAATIHIQALHWLMSFLYSRQIQALASLWRLFRGRKWNPLRQRLDSYDYNVEQHVVGSLLFTPLLLLLPTTSVFYIFFTILNTTICCICILIEITISILHATPYADILLWVTRRRRFPSGVWFEIISGCHGLDQRKTIDPVNKRVLQTVVSLLHSNYATLAQIVAPYYKNLFQRLTLSIDGPSAYGILSGQRTPSTLKINLKPALPWMQISCLEYWRLCHSSVLACRPS